MDEALKKHRAARYALAVAVAAALSFPFVSQGLRAQDDPAPAQAKPAARAEPAAETDAADKAKPADPADDPAQPAGDSDAAADDKAEPGAKGDAAPAGEAGSRVIASAGEIKITAVDFETFVSGMPPQDQQQIKTQPETRRRVAEHLVKMKALAREAERRKLDQDPKLLEELERMEKQFAAHLENTRLQMLATAVVTTLQSDDAADKKYFEEHPERFGKVQARHILIGTRNADPNSTKPPLTEEQAKKKADEVRARLAKGEDFASVAKAESDDPGSKNTGGSYTFGRGDMVPAFEQTAFALKENEISQPVKTPFGYHIIQLQKRLPGTFEASRADIGAARVENFVKDLLGAEPKLDDAYFSAAPRVPGPAAAGKGAPTPKGLEKTAPKGAK